MTATEVATAIIDKLQEENRVCLETLHKAQDTIKYSERQLAEKDRLIKVLEERIRTGTDGILEMTNRQKELTIKHLELQIQKLLKENEDLEVGLEAIKAEICPKCETKLLQRENNENKVVSKSYKLSGKSSTSLFGKKSSQTVCPNRVKALERIIEHKDRRIMHLSKEVQRLTKIEKELTQKVYRLTKLLPMSRLPPDGVTDCLLREIQLLESQNQGCNVSDIKLRKVDNILKKYPSSQTSLSKVNLSKPPGRFNKSAPTKKISTVNLPESEQADVSDFNRLENEVLLKKLQKLCNDINELKRLFAFESEKLSYGLNSAANDYHSFRNHLEEIIDNLNDIVQSILSSGFNVQQQDILEDPSLNHDDKYVVSCLQERLKESLAMITEYENENKALKESLTTLKSQMSQENSYSADYKNYEVKKYKSFLDSKEALNINDVKKLKEVIKIKDTQLDAAESHIDSCQKFIEELQRTRRHFPENSKTQCSLSSGDEVRGTYYEQKNKELQIKVDVFEKQIKTCERIIEHLKEKSLQLEEENARIESELCLMKSKAMSEPDYQSSLVSSKQSDSHINTLKKFNQELQDKVKSLEEANAKLEAIKKSSESQNIFLQAADQEKTLLKSKLDTSEKSICSLKKGIEMLQDKTKSLEEEKKILEDKLKTVEDEKNKLQDEIRNFALENNLAEKYEDDVMALKSEIFLKEDENRELKESLHTLENKTLEMNHYRKTLHQEIENLCKALTENEESEDSERRKLIYKAAVLRSAQALLRLDDNFNFKPDDSDRSSALDEMSHQIQVYLTEVSRIHELVTIKEQERYELLKEYLDLEDDTVLRPTSTRHHETHVQGEPIDDNLQSSPNLNPLQNPSREQLSKSTIGSSKNTKFESSETLAKLKAVENELASTQSVTTYLLSNCTRLEEMVNFETAERAKCERDLQAAQELVKDLRTQITMKNNMAKRLNSLIDMMRSKECNDEISLEQLKSEIKWLVDENQKVNERIFATQTELCQCKEENCKIKNDLDSMKRQLVNEKFEHAKVNNELKHLKQQIANSQSMLHDI